MSAPKRDAKDAGEEVEFSMCFVRSGASNILCVRVVFHIHHHAASVWYRPSHSAAVHVCGGSFRRHVGNMTP